MRNRILKETCCLLLAVSLSGSTPTVTAMSPDEPARAASAGQPERNPESSTPPWKRQLSGESAARIEKLDQQIARLRGEGKFAEAAGSAKRSPRPAARRWAPRTGRQPTPSERRPTCGALPR